MCGSSFHLIFFSLFPVHVDVINLTWYIVWYIKAKIKCVHICRFLNGPHILPYESIAFKYKTNILHTTFRISISPCCVCVCASACVLFNHHFICIQISCLPREAYQMGTPIIFFSSFFVVSCMPSLSLEYDICRRSLFRVRIQQIDR